MAESFRLSVGVLGEGERPGRITSTTRVPSLDEVLSTVRKLPISDEQKRYLEAMAKKVPNGSLGNFLKNYRLHLKKLEK